MKIQTSTLSNKLKIVTAEFTDAYSATVSIAVGVGSRYENAKTNNGLSHFLEHLMFKGTEKRPTTKIISEQIDAVGGWSNAYTSNEVTNYYVKLPYQHVGLGLDILADMLQNSLLDAEEIDRERNVVIEEMNVYQDDPASYVHRLTPALLWPGHALSLPVIGTEDIIKNVSRDAIVDYHHEYYQPNNMVVSVAGRVKHKEVVAQVEKLFGSLKEGQFEKTKPVKKELDSQKTASLQKDTAQTHLVISTTAYSYQHPDDPAARLVATILGQGLSSRLFENVRERKGLAYSVYAGTENFVDTGEFEVYAGVNNSKVSDAIEAIIEELTTIANETVKEPELDKVKNQMRGALMMAMESNTAVSNRNGTQLLLLGELELVDQTLAKIDAVTAEDIKRVASQMLDPERLRLGIIASDPEPAVTKFTQLTSK